MNPVNLFCRAALNSGDCFLPKAVLNYACCKSVLQSSTEQWGLHFALSSAALHWCWVTAHLYEEQISTGVVAEKLCML